MKPLCDYHVHTVFSDGKNTPEEMVKAAIDKDISELGFSDHSYTFFDESYCVKREKIAEYKREIARLKNEYKDKIKILCGIEQDYYSAESTDGYDYAIGSVHYVQLGEKYLPVDESENDFKAIAENCFGGDYYAFSEEYFKTVAGFAERKDIKIIGHFDLITKFNENGKLFDENDNRYITAWKNAADKLLAAGKTFEINTGAISRGYKTEPYPSNTIREYIKSKGGKFVFGSDSHHKNALCYDFDKYEKEI
ncbi:MAG: histidinol-phosphatase [Clostridia bacterium]|nr:histidinol-phosphatase [Clostridia bacterium]